MIDVRQQIVDYILSIKKDITKRAIEKDQVVTGETIESLAVWTRNNNIQLVGNENILKLEFGTSPSEAKKQRDLEVSLGEWVLGRGLNFDPKRLANQIRDKGTLLYQGLDDRFSGNTSGTISDFVNEKIIPEIENILLSAIEANINEQLIQQNNGDNSR